MSLSGIAVFWDFDDTLAYRNGKWGSALLEALREVNPESGVGKDDLSPYLQTGFPWHDPDTPHLHLCDPDDWWSHMQSLLSGALLKAGVNEPDAIACVSKARGCFLRPSTWSLYGDSIAALTKVVESGGRNIVLSNHVPELAWLARQLGLTSLLDGVVSSALTGYEKPHPRAFEIALEQAGNPAAAYMIGDNPVADVGGAEAVGIKGILIQRRGAADGVLSLLDAVRLVGL